MDIIIQAAIVAVILTAIYYITTVIPFLAPFQKIIQIVIGAIAVIYLLSVLARFV